MKTERILKSDFAKERLKEMKPVFDYKDLQKQLLDVATTKSKVLGDEALDDLLRQLRDKFKALKTKYPDIENMVKKFDEDGIFQVKDLNVTKELDNLLKQDGYLLLEIGGSDQQNAVESIFQNAGFNTEFFKDLQQDWRMVEVRR